MYTEAPFEEITLDEFELVALDRLQVLRKIEDLKVRQDGCRPRWHQFKLRRRGWRTPQACRARVADACIASMLGSVRGDEVASPTTSTADPSGSL